MEAHGERLWWWWPAAFGVVVAVVLGAFVTADAIRDRHRADVARDDVAAVSAVALSVADEASTTLRTLRLDGAALGLAPALAARGAPAGATAVAVVGPADGGLVIEAGDLPAAIVEAEEVVVAVGTARDGARSVLAAPVPGEGASVYVIPVYEVAGARATELPSASTAARRAAWVGAVLLELDVDALLGDLPDPVRVADGAVPLAGRGEVGGSTVASAVPVAGRRWVVEVPAGSAGTPLGAVLAVVAGLGAAALLLLGQRSATRAVAGFAARAEARARQAGTVRRVAPLVQQSSDLGDVLPAVAVLLEEELGLDGFALTVLGTDGADHVLFASGRPVVADQRPDPDRTSLEVGETLAVGLRRADRDVGALRVRASRRLGSFDVESVRAAAELLAAALISAQAFERQEAAMAALRQVDELKNVFLGVASHELRTPVTAIGGFARLLVQRWEQLPEDQRRALAGRIEANAASLGVLVQDLLDFSRLERGRFVVGTDAVDLAGGLEAVVDRLGSIWGDREIEVVIEDRPVVLGDGDALDRVAANLLSNAAKFSPDGAPIVATVAIEDGRAVLRVDDAGPGVPEAERDHIWSAFFRGKGDAVVRTRGAGIGLSVVKEIVEQMDGTISVSTSPAGGARFEVLLPLDQQLEEVVP